MLTIYRDRDFAWHIEIINIYSNLIFCSYRFSRLNLIVPVTSSQTTFGKFLNKEKSILTARTGKALNLLTQIIQFNRLPAPSEDDYNWHLQAQYIYRLNKNISLNPGVIAIINPENNSDNDTVYVGTLRTIFMF